MQPNVENAIRAFTRNPKRFGLLVGFAGLTILLFGRTLLNGPASSPASMIRNTIPAESLGVHGQPSSAVLDWLAQPKRPVQRNLFASKLDSYADPIAPASMPGNLELQTTIMEDPPRAMVNGQLLQEGDIIDGYTIVKIQPRKIFVQQDGPVIEIEMP